MFIRNLVLLIILCAGAAAFAAGPAIQERRSRFYCPTRFQPDFKGNKYLPIPFRVGKTSGYVVSNGERFYYWITKKDVNAIKGDIKIKVPGAYIEMEDGSHFGKVKTGPFENQLNVFPDSSEKLYSSLEELYKSEKIPMNERSTFREDDFVYFNNILEYLERGLPSNSLIWKVHFGITPEKFMAACVKELEVLVKYNCMDPALRVRVINAVSRLNARFNMSIEKAAGSEAQSIVRSMKECDNKESHRRRNESSVGSDGSDVITE